MPSCGKPFWFWRFGAGYKRLVCEPEKIETINFCLAVSDQYYIEPVFVVLWLKTQK